MNLNGVDPNVINDVNNLQVDEVDPQRRYVNLGMGLNEREALFAVGFLHGILSQESSTMGDNQHQTTTTGLILSPLFIEVGGDYSDEAVTVFCSFLNVTTTLPALHLSGFPAVQLRRLLGTLHTNVSVKELKLGSVGYVQPNDDATCITELLRHKSDFTVLGFENCAPVEILLHLLPFLRQGSAILQKLEIDECDIGDAGTHLLVDALVNSNTKYNNLKTLSLTSNGITPDGFQCLSKLDADVLPGLKCLILSGNYDLLDDAESTKLFVQKILLSQRTTLKALYLQHCSKQAVGYNIIIKSLESNQTLLVLYMIHRLGTDNKQRIHDQLLESLPKITGVQDLQIRSFNLDNERTMAAFRQNVSLFQVTDYGGTQFSNDARLGPILKRNQLFVHLDAMLGTAATATANQQNTTTTTTTSPLPPRGIWAPVLAKVGQGNEGGSLVFKILQHQLATWASETTSSSSNHGFKKHSHGQEACATQIESSKKKRKQG